MQRIAIAVTGYPGSGSTTFGKNIAKVLGFPPPFYAGSVVRCLAEKIEENGRNTVLAMPKKELRAMVAEMMRSGRVPLRPNIAEEYARFPQELDRLIEEIQFDLLKEEAIGVHEGRMAAHLVRQLKTAGEAPDKLFIRICCVAEEEERMKRLKSRDEYGGKSIEEVRQESNARLATERVRYKELYGIDDHLAAEHFDFVVDTTHFSREENLARALAEIERLHPGLLAQFIPEK